MNLRLQYPVNFKQSKTFLRALFSVSRLQYPVNLIMDIGDGKMTDDEKEQLILSEVNEMYKKHWKESDKMINENPNITEQECNKFDIKFYKELSDFVKKRKRELKLK